MNKCYFCGKESEDKVYRTSLCTSCGRELKICFNCRFFDRNAAGQCREPQAEKVQDKDRANFCDFFESSGNSHVKEGEDKASLAKKSFEDLFS